MPHTPWHLVICCHVLIALISGCSASSSGDDPTNAGGPLINGNFALAYVKRPVASLGNPADATTFAPGGDLYIRDIASPSADERNITYRYTLGVGDVSDPEVSFDGRRVVFAMRGAEDATWDIWEYTIANDNLIRVMRDTELAAAGDDVDPAYLPDGRIVFISNRQTRAREQQTVRQVEPFAAGDEDGRAPALVLHTMDNDGRNVRQISFGQSHERNPTVLRTGEILFARWDHTGPRNQFSLYYTDPDGTGMDILYGAHSPGASFLQPREMQNGRIISTLMPLSGTAEGGALVVIDIANFSEHNAPAPGINSGQGQTQPTLYEIPLASGLSRYGRYTTPYPLWDDTNRLLVSWTPSQAQTGSHPLTGIEQQIEGNPTYGVYLLNLDDQTMRPMVTVPAGYVVTDAVAVMPRALPNVLPDTALDRGPEPALSGILNVKSVYDTDAFERMGAAVLAAGETIPMIAGAANDTRTQVADLVRLKDTALPAAARPARFVRVTRAVALPPGFSRQLVGETPYEMQQILGYAEVEPDGSVKLRVPADTPLTLSVLDADGRAFASHTNWLQVRNNETRTCNGCHSPRRGTALNVVPIAGDHPPLFGVPAPGLIHVHPGVSATATFNAVDPEGDALTFRIVDAPTQGTVVIIDQSTGTFTYTARTDAQIGKDTFTFVANDGATDSNIATFTVNVHATPRPNQGESMAETRVRVFPDVAELRKDLVYEDVWGEQSNPCLHLQYTGTTDCTGIALPAEDLTTLAPINGIIHYPDHIQPLWTKNRDTNTCTNCHNNSDRNDPASVGLDLSTTLASNGHLVSYQALLIGVVPRDEQGLPVFTEIDRVPKVLRDAALVVPGMARESYLIEKLFNRDLRAARTVLGNVDHSPMLNRAEKRLVTEWIDIGAQYYNDPYDVDRNGNGVKDLAELRTDTRGLNRDEFASKVYPILQRRCTGCHRAASSEGGLPTLDFTLNRYVLSGAVDNDYFASVSMVSDITRPLTNPLLVFPRSGHATTYPLHPLITSPALAGQSFPVLDPNNPVDTDVVSDHQILLNWIEIARLNNGP